MLFRSIDKAFIKGLPHDEDDMAVATAVISLGHKLRLKVIAEGVETQEQADFLRHHHCDEIQGYCVSRPVPPDAFETFLRDWVERGRQSAAALVRAAAHMKAARVRCPRG